LRTGQDNRLQNSAEGLYVPIRMTSKETSSVALSIWTSRRFRSL
jgi:hypothetical protein